MCIVSVVSAKDALYNALQCGAAACCSAAAALQIWDNSVFEAIFSEFEAEQKQNKGLIKNSVANVL